MSVTSYRYTLPKKISCHYLTFSQQTECFTLPHRTELLQGTVHHVRSDLNVRFLLGCIITLVCLFGAFLGLSIGIISIMDPQMKMALAIVVLWIATGLAAACVTPSMAIITFKDLQLARGRRVL